jgi:hypothetical protein
VRAKWVSLVVREVGKVGGSSTVKRIFLYVKGREMERPERVRAKE